MIGVRESCEKSQGFFYRKNSVWYCIYKINIYIYTKKQTNTSIMSENRSHYRERTEHFEEFSSVFENQLKKIIDNPSKSLEDQKLITHLMNLLKIHEIQNKRLEISGKKLNGQIEQELFEHDFNLYTTLLKDTTLTFISLLTEDYNN